MVEILHYFHDHYQVSDDSCINIRNDYLSDKLRNTHYVLLPIISVILYKSNASEFKFLV